MKQSQLWVIIWILVIYSCQPRGGQGPLFEIILSETLIDQAQDGRLILMLSTNDASEPRFQISDGPESQLAFGIDEPQRIGFRNQRKKRSAVGYLGSHLFSCR